MLALLAAHPAFANSQHLSSQILRYLDNGGVVVTHDGEVLEGHREKERFVPASTLKIATALAAIHYLGLDYRFKTEFYSSELGDLTIRGHGDPFLVSEEWKSIVDELDDSGKLPRVIRNLYLDTSTFSDGIEIPGVEPSLNPYDAVNGALAANFNSIYLQVARNGTVRSAESQTPLTPLGRELAARLPPGRHRINISKDPEIPVRYVGELMKEFLAKKGHDVRGEIRTRPRAPTARHIHTHFNSRTLEEVIEAMMLYSNNFIANQLLLVIALEQTGGPATLEEGIRYLDRYLIGELGLERSEFEVVEGSGISPENSFTPVALAKTLSAFYPHRHLLTEEQGVLLKTGTLEGVYTLAGYLPSKYPLCFVIMLDQARNTRDRILSVLKRETRRAFESRLARQR